MSEKKIKKIKEEVLHPIELDFIEEVIAEETKEKEIVSKEPSFTLVRIPQGIFHDIYGRPEIISDRMGWINKKAMHVVKVVEESEYKGRVIITDIYRKPTESYIARKKKGSMVAPCGLSGHNYGISIDVDVQATAKSFGMNPENMRKELNMLGLKSITTEAWHFNLVFNPERDYFLSLYNGCSKEFLAHVNEIFLEKFNSVCGMSLKSVSTVQAALDLTIDGVFGPKTFLATTMLMAEHMGMINTLTKETDELTIDFGAVWK